MHSNSIKLELIPLVQKGKKYKAIYEKRQEKNRHLKPVMQKVDAIAATHDPATITT
jgi:hypothetical protein